MQTDDSTSAGARGTAANPAARRPPRFLILVCGAALVVVGVLAAGVLAAFGALPGWWVVADDLPGPVCLPPTATELADRTARSHVLVRATVERVVTLDDGTTRGEGWTMRVVQQDSGATSPQAAAGKTIAVWPEVADGSLEPGEQVLLWLAQEHPGTRADTAATAAFDSRGLLVEQKDGGAVSRVCPGSRSTPVDATVLG
jgi:hypothetical protein